MPDRLATEGNGSVLGYSMYMQPEDGHSRRSGDGGLDILREGRAAAEGGSVMK